MPAEGAAASLEREEPAAAREMALGLSLRGPRRHGERAREKGPVLSRGSAHNMNDLQNSYWAMRSSVTLF